MLVGIELFGFGVRARGASVARTEVLAGAIVLLLSPPSTSLQVQMSVNSEYP